MSTHFFAALTCAAALLSVAPAQALTTAEAEHLGQDLTPNGAERAGNKEGTIPAWTGGLTQPPAGWTPEMGYIDPFKDDKPLFTITGQNAEKYKDKLSAGLMALLKKHANLYLPIYPSRRSFANPPAVYEATKAQASKVSLKGLTLSGYSAPGTPFPVPATGVEAMYNHLSRFIGSAKRCTDWLPVRPNGDYYRVGFCEDLVQGQNFDERQKNHLFSLYAGYDAPASLVGTVYLLHDPLDYSADNRLAWIYNAGQRRVRRAPDFAYDSTTDGDEGMRVTDDYWGFNGALDRYEWKLLGKREMYIPYNSYRANDKKLQYKDMVDKGSLKSELTRYELHRVWEVEATLKRGETHSYGKRVFYLDEDSYLVALADAYDTKGKLYRTHTLALMQAYDAQVMIQAPFVQHDLSSGAYLAEGLSNERKEPIVWHQKRKWADFQPDAIRRRGIR